MNPTQPLVLSTACLLRVTLFVGTALSVFLSPHELAYKQWMSEPIRQKKEEKPTPTGTNPVGRMISLKIKKAEKQFHPLIIKACKKYGVDPALVKALICAESGYDPQAVSAKGAVGLMQLMPHVIDAFAVKDAFDPVHNINGGVGYLSELIGYFDGDHYLGLAAYNAGIGRIEQPGPFPKATQNFIQRVFEYYDYYQTSSGGINNRA
jgi:soluble lytic murein transglycosylase-like protein